jgi:hypothetical protein
MQELNDFDLEIKSAGCSRTVQHSTDGEKPVQELTDRALEMYSAGRGKIIRKETR